MDNGADLLQRLINFEKGIVADRPPPKGLLPFAYVSGEIPVVVSAPHGTGHWRRNRLKEPDEYTSAFAQLVGDLTGAHVVFATYQSDCDPNYDEEVPYKRLLRQLVGDHQIRFVLDLHGMRDGHGIGMAIGTMNGRSCSQGVLNLLTGTLISHGFLPTTTDAASARPQLAWNQFVVNHKRFTGGVSNHTVTRYVTEQLGIPAAQFELAGSLRLARRWTKSNAEANGDGAALPVVRAIQALVELVMRISQGGW